MGPLSLGAHLRTADDSFSFHYDALVQLFQTPGYVVLLKEMIHEVRIVPLDGRPHLGPTIGPWRGESRGRWEGLRFADIRIPGARLYTRPISSSPQYEHRRVRSQQI